MKPARGPAKKLARGPVKGPSAADARAEQQARQRQQRAANQSALDAHFESGIPGRSLIIATWVATIVFAAAELIGVVTYSERHPGAGQQLAAVVALGLFALGLLAFCWAIYAGAQRSRTALFGIGGWFLLAGSAPRSVRLSLLASVGAQLTIGLVAASIRPFSELAFGTLVWVFGLAVCGVWGARFGHFAARPDPEPVTRARAR